jgi:hypothetical protein
MFLVAAAPRFRPFPLRALLSVRSDDRTSPLVQWPVYRVDVEMDPNCGIDVQIAVSVSGY